ncbi:hypothetical protein TNCT_583971 [Trichonephila clavata]|uniref:Uncharacterized protein n=1 Tax=Trichonephila clavata TaxID=2740835 RepID=A0A8X6JLD6_TRICU|nr:hypothetical protein TNCT_583971 [Trichonephila clavata]
MIAGEAKHSNSEEQITHLQLIKSGFEAKNTLIEGGVYRNFNDSSLHLLVENIRKLEFSNTYSENPFQNSEHLLFNQQQIKDAIRRLKTINH